MHIVLDPSRFVGLDAFKQSLSQELDELAAEPPAEGYGKVYYPGERSAIRKEKADAEGVEIVEEIVEYLKGDTLHFDRYDHKNRFAD